ncbi:hypothetical protein ONR57_08910 [Hoyosella sp. YIM 151337]|uniref:hypothetical protein n=1 Tax=Hoyosella sp. YIM 151337 TaxID=2992742 RepID=UPI002235CD0A|nr:hypothetical protein [Hoyosella sp. YIM 151337]MCW4353415.1 hypothetical protein [Hoyosella sp. YIM 151337]
MSRTHRAGARVAASVLAAGIGGAVLISGCGAKDTAPVVAPVSPSPVVPREDGAPMHGDYGIETPQNATVQQVTVNALTQIYTWQPAIEPNRGAALIRAKDWLGGPLLAAAEAGLSESGVRHDADWDRWAANGEIVSATVRVREVQETGPGLAEARTSVTQRVMGQRSGVIAEKTFTVLAELEYSGGAWGLTGYRETY